MPYLHDLLLVQMGTEVSSDTYGCDVPPTVQLEGIDLFTITPILRSEQHGTRYGTLAPAHVSVRTLEEATASLGGYLNYDDAPYWLDALFGRSDTSDVASYTTDADGVISRLYKAPLATFDTDLGATRIYTMAQAEAGLTTDDCYNIQGAIAKSANFSFDAGATARFAVDFIGRESLPDELATNVTNRTVTYVMGNHGSLYIDPSSDAAGSGTALATTAFKADLSIDTGRTLQRHLGSLTPDGYQNAKWTGKLALSLELNSTTAGYLDALLAGTSAYEKVIRLKFTTGSGATEQKFQIDFNGIIVDAPTTFTAIAGVITVEMNFVGQYNATMANWLKITSINTVAALA